MRDSRAMGGVLLAVAVAALLGSTGFAAAASIGVRNVAELLLAAYLIAFAEIVALALLLSPFDALSRAGFLVGITALFVVAVAVWLALGRPRPVTPHWLGVRAVVGTPLLRVLVSTVVLALAYLAALIVATAPNSWDSLAYHLSRAAFWTQAGHVGYIPNAYDGRLNGSPPNAEITLAFVFEVTGNERFVGFVEFVAALACAVGVFVLARRLGLTQREAAFGAFVFLTLPIVLLQAPTTQSDLVVASMLTAGAVFVIGSSSGAMVLAALATALAVGTKVPAVFGLPVLAVVALTAPEKNWRLARLLALAAGTAVGAYWYAFNIHSSGQVFGPAIGTGEGVGGSGYIRSPQEAFLTALGLMVDSFDLSGSRGADIFLYVVAAALVALLVGISAARGSAHRVGYALLAGALALLPLALYPGSYVARRVLAKLHHLLSGETWFGVRDWDPTRSGENFSWFGPVGFFLVSAVCVTTVVLIRRGKLPARAALYAVAPFVWLALLALTLTYNPWHGRLFIFPVAMSAALWGLCLRARPVAWAIVSVAATTTVLALVNNQSKPSGLRLIEPDPPASVWTMDRWEVQALQRKAAGPVLQFFEERVPHSARVALALTYNEFGYPPFGATRARTVTNAAPGSDGRDVLDADWIFASYPRGPEIDLRCWRRVYDDGEHWSIFRRRVGTCT